MTNERIKFAPIFSAGSSTHIALTPMLHDCCVSESSQNNFDGVVEMI